jgi:hypothetical protein
VNVETIHEHESLGRRGFGGEQQAVVTARSDSTHGPGREPAQAIGLKPFSMILPRGLH